MPKITYENKVGTVPKGTHINQFWAEDANEVKAVVNDNDSRVTVNEAGISQNTADIADWTTDKNDIPRLSGNNTFIGDNIFTKVLTVDNKAVRAKEFILDDQGSDGGGFYWSSGSGGSAILFGVSTEFNIRNYSGETYLHIDDGYSGEQGLHLPYNTIARLDAALAGGTANDQMGATIGWVEDYVTNNSGGIGGSIADEQIAFGSGTDITGSSDLTYETGNELINRDGQIWVTPTDGGVVDKISSNQTTLNNAITANFAGKSGVGLWAAAELTSGTTLINVYGINGFGYLTGASSPTEPTGSAPFNSVGGRYATRLEDTANGHTVVGASGYVDHGGSGTVVNAYAFLSEKPVVDTGNTITNYVNFKAITGAIDGTITNYYGMYIDELTTGSNNWGIYTAGATENYFGGKVQVIGDPTTGDHVGNRDYNDARYLSSGEAIGGSITDNQIAVGATTADEIEGSSGLTWDSNEMSVEGDIVLESEPGAATVGNQLIIHSGATAGFPREVTLDAGGLKLNIISANTGWVNNFGVGQIDGVNSFGFGSYGSSQSFIYGWFGSAYNSADIKIGSNGQVGINSYTSVGSPNASYKFSVGGKVWFDDTLTLDGDPTGGTHVGNRDYNDARYSSRSIDSKSVAVDYTAVSADNGMEITLTSGATEITLDDSGCAVDDNFVFYNRSGGTITWALGTDDAVIEGTPLNLADKQYAYVALKAANSWSVVVTSEDTVSKFDHLSNGLTIQKQTTDITSNGTVITFSTEAIGGGDIDFIFDGQVVTLDCTPAATVALTAGTDTVPVMNYIYVTDAGVLTSGITFPTGNFALLAKAVLQSASTTQSDGPLTLQRCSDYVGESGDDVRGRIDFIAESLRIRGAKWYSGVAPSSSVVGDGICIATGSGIVYQLHRQTWTATLADESQDMYIVNDPTTPYRKITNFDEITETLDGSISTGRDFAVYMYGFQSSGGGDSRILISLPDDDYNSVANALKDTNAYDNNTLPPEFIGGAFSIARVILTKTASGCSLGELQDIRGMAINSQGVGGGSAQAQTFVDTIFRVYDNTDPTKMIAMQASEITTATTRTITMPDNDVDLGKPISSPIRTVTGTTDTLSITDTGTYIRCTNGAATTVTVPPNSSVAFTINTEIHVRQAGAGQVTIAEGSGVTINTEETLLLKAQHSTITLKKVGTDEWDIMGSLEPV